MLTALIHRPLKFHIIPVKVKNVIAPTHRPTHLPMCWSMHYQRVLPRNFQVHLFWWQKASSVWSLTAAWVFEPIKSLWFSEKSWVRFISLNLINLNRSQNDFKIIYSWTCSWFLINKALTRILSLSYTLFQNGGQ